jgi:sugar/nucleoside kinase (ribokinase family)
MCIGGVVVDIFACPDQPGARVRAGGAPHSQKDAFHFALGEKIRLKDVRECYGGGAANVSVGLSRLGLSCSILSLVGDDAWGERILMNLKREGVNGDSINVIEGEVSPFSIILLSESGERTVLHSAGVREHLCDPMFDRDAVSEARSVVLMPLVERGCDILDDLLELLESNPSMAFVWNPGSFQIGSGLKSSVLRGLAKRATILCLNEEELLTFSGEGDLLSGILALKEAGTTCVCVTRGGEGAVAVRGNEACSCPVAPANVVDTTGAGDAFVTGFTWASLRGDDLQTCLRAGTLNSAGVVSEIGAQPGLLTEMQMTQRLLDTPLLVSPFRIRHV